MRQHRIKFNFKSIFTNEMKQKEVKSVLKQEINETLIKEEIFHKINQNNFK